MRTGTPALRIGLALAAVSMVQACTEPAAESSTATPAAPTQATPAPSAVPAVNDAADAFFAALSQHCGRAYRGLVINDLPATEPNAFTTSDLVMHVRECGESELRIPFAVGDDLSRTWVLTRTDTGLRLKHDHRHQDGSEDAVTQYGGDSDAKGGAQRQQFPVDAESIANFQANGLEASVTNTWALEIEVDNRFLYELSRPSGRLFQVEFDLSQPVEPPPAPWGSASD